MPDPKACILVMDTSLNACSVGLFRGDTCLFERYEPMQRGHQERLGPLVAEAFSQAGITPKALSHIGVTLGPGSFTGMRVGLAFAKGLAIGLGLPLKGIGTLESLGHHPDLAAKTCLSVIDGGRGHIYVQVLGGDILSSPQILNLNDTAQIQAFAVTHPIARLTGPAAPLLADYWPDADLFEQAWPSLVALARLTQGADPYSDLTPLYMRDADAIASTRGIISLGEAGPV